MAGRRSIALVVCAGVVLALTLSSCGDDGGDNEPSATDMPAVTANGTPEPTEPVSAEAATATAEFVATAIASLRDRVPVVNEDLAPDWSEEGEPARTIDAVCPPEGVAASPFTQATSRLLTRDGEQARSSAVLYAEQVNTIQYRTQVFDAAAACAAQLALDWFGETVEFGAPAEEFGVGEEAVVAESADGSSAVIFFKVEEAVAAVAVIGGESRASARDLAIALVPEIDELLSGGLSGS